MPTRAMVEITGPSMAKAEIYFQVGPDCLSSSFDSDSKYWSQELRRALGQQESSGAFPPQLKPNDLKGLSLPIPTVDIYAMPDHYFTTKFRDIFQKTKLTYHLGKE